MEFFIIYLLMVLGNIKVFFFVAGCITICIGAIGCLVHAMDQEDVGCFKWWLIVGVFALLLVALIPDRKEMAIIAATGVTYNIVTSEEAKGIGNKGVELLNKKLDDWMADELPVKSK